MPASSAPQARQVARVLGGLRLLIGVVALSRPELPAAVWVGRDSAAQHGVQLFARTLGARDLALGTASLLARGDQELSRMTAVSALADAIDGGSTLMTFARLPKVWRYGVLASTFGAAALGAGAALVLRDPR